MITDRRGPVLLEEFFEESGLLHIALPGLTRGSVAEALRRDGISVGDIGDPAEKLAGFVFVAGSVGLAFVSADDPLPRRRFTAAHELGHFKLHRADMGGFRAEAVMPDASLDASDLIRMEREANQFAADLLMPAEVCRARAGELSREYGCCPRLVLGYRLASELLVSREAMHYRLRDLRVGDE